LITEELDGVEKSVENLETLIQLARYWEVNDRGIGSSSQ
jgi:hypothetical protein